MRDQLCRVGIYYRSTWGMIHRQQPAFSLSCVRLERGEGGVKRRNETFKIEIFL